uniref:Uncharacterized protein n=1 Tax=viral metagenome TaxID=1070528 RepID=A0A6H1ZGS4_9ZZZZ
MKQPVPIFLGYVDKKTGKLKMLDFVKEEIRRWCLTLKGKEVDIVIKKHRKDRTNDQNAYYWGVVVPILADYFGHDNPEDMHEDLKLEFNPIESKIEPGKRIGGTTTNMSTEEFFCGETSYVERICRWAAAEHGVYIPPPKKAE